MRMIRTSNWKLVRDFLNPERDELFDLKNDPAESRNVIGQKKNAVVVRELHPNPYPYEGREGSCTEKDQTLTLLRQQESPKPAVHQFEGRLTRKPFDFARSLADDSPRDFHAAIFCNNPLLSPPVLAGCKPSARTNLTRTPCEPKATVCCSLTRPRF